MRLIIEAADGAAYLANARLIGDGGAGGRTLAEGQACIAARPSFNNVAAGTYRFARMREFPVEPAVQKEFGRHGLLFDPVSTTAGGEPLLVHGGAFGAPGQRHAASGSVRLEAALLGALVARVERLGLAAARAGLVLELRVGERPPFWKFWAQPARSRAVVVDEDDDGADFFDVMVPELAPYRHPNSAMAWMLYFDRERREDGGGQHASRPAEDRAPARGADVDELPPEAAPSAPLFGVSDLPGVDAQGRVRDAPAAAPEQCLRSDDRGDRRDDAMRAAGLTLTALAAEAIEADPLAAVDLGNAAGSLEAPTDAGDASDSLVEASTSY